MDFGFVAVVAPIIIISALGLCCLSDWLSGRFVDNHEDNRARARIGHHSRQNDGGEDD